ncbi:MAG: T9SS type A sorting domain-containing protein, partial [Bacteroidota bacterium]
TCVPPANNSIDIFRVRSTTADIRFNSSSPGTNPSYLIQYGPGNFDPATDDNGIDLTTQDTSLRVSNLASDTLYTFWISTICQTENDTTIRRGPFEIMTQKRADVGITRLMSPATACNLSTEEVTIGITNFGGEAQAFFNVDFTINGQPSTVSRPADGIFTGVVGVDSTEFFTFDASVFLNQPGTYTLEVWTELEDDEDTSNDTMTFAVTHVPQIATFPYYESFEANDGFWYSERGGRGISSWRWGTPFANTISGAPNGQNAWVTNLGGDYNDRERSYLVSPCFDLSAMEEDPLFGAIIRVQTETDFDAVYLEMTTDEGENWSRVNSSPAATGWYNDLANQVWEGDGGFGDRAAQVSNLLEGTAGDTIQLRFVFESSRSTTLEGVLVDGVSISERAEQDFAVIAVNKGAECLGIPPSIYSVTVANLGTEPVNGFDLNFNVTGTENSEFIDDTILPGQYATVRLVTGDGPNYALAPLPFWVSLAGDNNISNDTAYLNMPTVAPVPFYEGFNDARVPNGWIIDEDGFSVSIDPRTNDLSLSTTTSGGFLTNVYDGFELGDSLRFSVSLSDADRPDTASFKASLTIVFTDCDQQLVIADIDSLENRDYAIPIEGAASGSFRFNVTITGDNAVISLDNINVPRCPNNLGLIADVVGVSSSGGRDAIATVTPSQGLPPFTFAWSTGDATQQVDGLAEGSVFVEVTDVVGCKDTVFFTVDMSTDTKDPLQILAGLEVFPNPTEGNLELRLDLPEAAELRATVYDGMGRQLLYQEFGRQLRLAEQLDFGAFPAGIYLLRLEAGGAARTVRVIRR